MLLVYIHTHPTTLAKLDYIDQEAELIQNYNILKEVTGEEAVVASYPCNSYNSDTINIMKKLGIKAVFTATLSTLNKKFQPFEVPRMDHADLIKKIKKLKE